MGTSFFPNCFSGTFDLEIEGFGDFLGILDQHTAARRLISASYSGMPGLTGLSWCRWNVVAADSEQVSSVLEALGSL